VRWPVVEQLSTASPLCLLSSMRVRTRSLRVPLRTVLPLIGIQHLPYLHSLISFLDTATNNTSDWKLRDRFGQGPCREPCPAGGHDQHRLLNGLFRSSPTCGHRPPYRRMNLLKPGERFSCHLLFERRHFRRGRIPCKELLRCIENFLFDL